jgi:hypothetical protein
LARIAGIDVDEMLERLRPYADRGWVEFDAAGLITSGVTMPETAVDLLPKLGYRVASYRGTGPAIASGWARRPRRWFPGIAVLLVVDTDVPGGHAMLARDGMLFDNNNPAGMPGLDHPHSQARVRVILRTYAGDEVAERRWPIVGDPAA